MYFAAHKHPRNRETEVGTEGVHEHAAAHVDCEVEYVADGLVEPINDQFADSLYLFLGGCGMLNTIQPQLRKKTHSSGAQNSGTFRYI